MRYADNGVAPTQAVSTHYVHVPSGTASLSGFHLLDTYDQNIIMKSHNKQVDSVVCCNRIILD